MTTYAIRMSKEANENVIEIAFDRVNWSGDPLDALRVEEAVTGRIATLATSPRRFVAAPEEAARIRANQ